MNERRETDLEIARLNEEKKQERAIATKNAEIADKDREISDLKAKLNSADTDKQLAVLQAKTEKDKEIAQKAQEITSLKEIIKVFKRIINNTLLNLSSFSSNNALR